MLAAYSFGSALELSDFCARHHIQAADTYAVLQSMAPYVFDEAIATSVLLTLVLDMPSSDLERIKERETDHQRAERDRLLEEEAQRNAAAAEAHKRWCEENSVDIPF